jgi:hypothetical protein
MADETITTDTVVTEVPVTETQPTTPADVKVEAPTAPVTDQSTVNTDGFPTKVDYKSLKGESLSIYKKLQADYTKARQSDKEILTKLKEQISSLNPLLNDNDVRAKAYYLQYGKYPNDYKPSFMPPEKPKEPELDMTTLDPVTRKIYEDNQKYQKYLQENEERQRQDLNDSTLKGVTAYVNKLSKPQRELWDKNIIAIQEFAEKSYNPKVSVDEAVKKAFYAACGDQLSELAKQEAIDAMTKKSQQPAPEKTANVAEVVSGEFNTAEEAVRDAVMRSISK